MAGGPAACRAPHRETERSNVPFDRAVCPFRGESRAYAARVIEAAGKWPPPPDRRAQPDGFHHRRGVDVAARSFSSQQSILVARRRQAPRRQVPCFHLELFPKAASPARHSQSSRASGHSQCGGRVGSAAATPRLPILSSSQRRRGRRRVRLLRGQLRAVAVALRPTLACARGEQAGEGAACRSRTRSSHRCSALFSCPSPCAGRLCRTATRPREAQPERSAAATRRGR